MSELREITTYFRLNGKAVYFVDSSNIIQGKFTRYEQDGKIRYVCNYVNDIKEGKFIGYFENGNASYESNFVNNVREGKHIEYYENGDISSEANYVNDKLDGPEINYNKDRTSATIYYSKGEIVN